MKEKVFLLEHKKYNQFTCTNEKESYAVNVKVQTFFHEDETDKLLSALGIIKHDSHKFWINFYPAKLKQFEDENIGFTFGFNGTNNGYLVLYRSNVAKKVETEESELDEMPEQNLKMLYYAVKNFDKCCNEIIEEFKKEVELLNPADK